MSGEVLGEIRMFAGTYAPVNWALCYGQIVAINNNEALFSLLGTMYGGDGRTSFGYPDLRGRIPMGTGQGVGLSNRIQGWRLGYERVRLTTDQIPAHTHQIQASTDQATSTTATSAETFGDPSPGFIYQDYDSGTMEANMKTLPTECIENAGGDDYHENMMPCLGVNFIMCLNGLYPSRN